MFVFSNVSVKCKVSFCNVVFIYHSKVIELIVSDPLLGSELLFGRSNINGLQLKVSITKLIIGVG